MIRPNMATAPLSGRIQSASCRVLWASTNECINGFSPLSRWLLRMTSLIEEFFRTNRIILLAVYGQAFFILGLSVALQWRSESRLELARSVPLLSAFALGSALAIWGDVSIRIQETYVD